MAELIKGTDTDKWLGQNFRKCTFPILTSPGKSHSDILGSAFLLNFKNLHFIITAKHVAQNEDILIGFPNKDKGGTTVKISDLEKMGLKWINHPAGLDISALPFIFQPKVVDNLDIIPIPGNLWMKQSKIEVNSWVAHLGFPERGSSFYTDGSPSFFPIAMPGEIINLRKTEIWVRSAASRGASGGPLFLKRVNNKPLLIGIVTEAKAKGKHTRPDEHVYLEEKTVGLFISLVKDIIASKEMVEMFSQA